MLIVDSQEEHRRIRHNTVVLSAFARTIPEVAWTHDTAMIIVFVGVCCVLGFDATVVVLAVVAGISGYHYHYH